MINKIQKSAYAAILFIALLITLVPIGAEAEAQSCDCLTSIPSVNSVSTIFEDNSPAMWVGGNFIAASDFKESEGLTVVRGNMIVQHNITLGVGVVGVGSGIVPTPDSVMLAVGGDLVATNSSMVIIGAPVSGTVTVPAHALIGGDVIGDVSAVYIDGLIISEDGRNIYDNLGPLAISHWAGFESELKAESAKYALMTPTGTATSLGGSITFDSNDISAPIQVFEINASDLAVATSYCDFYFTNIDQGSNGRYTPIVINVIGANATLFQTSVNINGTRVDGLATPNFGNAASAILWNFVDATYLEIPGSSQVMGSIIAPHTSTVNISAHTNGRLFVNGNLTRSGTNTEHHNYPWIGGGWYFKCSHEPLVGPPEPVVPPTSTQPPESAEPTASAEPTSSAEPTASPQPTESAEPTASTEPTASSQPSASAEPTQSAEPTASSQPTQSAEPTASSQPTASVQPTGSAQPTESAESGESESQVLGSNPVESESSNSSSISYQGNQDFPSVSDNSAVYVIDEPMDTRFNSNSEISENLVIPINPDFMDIPVFGNPFESDEHHTESFMEIPIGGNHDDSDTNGPNKDIPVIEANLPKTG
ncbi:MAG: choice-of-anchor A family protein [Oscillospiraceae bacterium]|nr:choice-of-anchor A family protein [Oscillospiraceae bacterium]